MRHQPLKFSSPITQVRAILVCLLLFLCYGCSYLQHKKSQAAVLLQNPVFNQDFPDPTIIYAEGKYYAYATTSSVKGKTIHIQIASSTDLQNWIHEGDALPVKPQWADRDFWAPHVLYDPDLKKYVLFYSGESTDTHTGKCLGVAYADRPTGPFVDKGTPLLCGPGFVDIDPMAFIDPKSGRKLLYWGSGFEAIKVQEMKSDWSGFKEGTMAKAVLEPGQDSDYSRLIEGAWVDYQDGQYYLYYSGDNCCGTQANYATMVARSNHPFGPFERYGQEEERKGNSAILVKDSLWLAPGHNSIFLDKRGQKMIAYHAINRLNNKGRVMCISELKYKKG